MSGAIENCQIREYQPSEGPNTALGLAQVTNNFDITLSKNTSVIEFGASGPVTTVPANDPLVAAWIVSITITVNLKHVVVRNLTRAEYIFLVSNLETKEADIISNGNMLMKVFNPPLQKGDRLQIQLVLNTLALATTTPAATATMQMRVLCYDTNDAPGSTLNYVFEHQQMPLPAAVLADVPVERNLGTQARKTRGITLLEQAIAVPQDIVSRNFQILADGNPVITLNNATAKRHYSLETDGILAPVGIYHIKAPAKGWQAAASTVLSVRATAHTAGATVSWRVWEHMTVQK
jgi:hypothetical protein